MKKRLLLIFIALFLVSGVIAVDYISTQIIVRTDPDSNIYLQIYDPDVNRMIGSFNTTTDNEGTITLFFRSILRNLSFDVDVSKDGSFVKTRNFSGYTAGEPVFLDLNEELIIENISLNETIEENITEEVEENATEENGTVLTGMAIEESKGLGNITIPNYVYFIIAGIVVAFLVAMSVVARLKIRKTPDQYKVTKLSDKQKENEVKETENKKLEEAEKKLREIQEEIEMLKSKDSKIEEARRRFEEAKADLEKLGEKV
jgi:hypothetical protein